MMKSVEACGEITRHMTRSWVAVLFASIAIWLATPSDSSCDVGDPINTGQHPYNREVVFSGYTGSETLTEFPLLLIFNTGITDFVYTEFKADGSDLRFASPGGIELAYEIEEWNPSGDSYIWVNVSEMASSTDLIKMYWGNPALNQPSYTTNGGVWSADYAGVWHMEETDPDDSTANGNDGTGDGNTNAAGLIVGAQDLDGTDDYIDISAVAASLSGSDFTVSMWVKTLDDNGAGNGASIITIHEDSNTTKAWLHIGGDGGDFDPGELYVSEGSSMEVETDTTVNNGSWRHICYTRTGTDADVYVDGVNEGSHNSAFSLSDDDIWGIGFQWGLTFLWDRSRFIDGTFDEMRVSNTERSADWIEACYDSQKTGANFVTYGDVATVLSLKALNIGLPETVAEGDGVVTGVVAVTVVPISNLVVNLVSDDTSEATVSNTVTILAGEPQAEFDISIEDDADLDGSQSATITASALIYAAGSNIITVLDNEHTNLIVSLPASATEGDGVLADAGSVSISGTLLSDLPVSLVSDDTTEASVTSMVTIAAGSTSTTFDVVIEDDSITDGVRTALVSAAAAGFAPGSDSIEVADNDVHHFAWDPIAPTQHIDTPFPVTITARDASNYTVAAFSGDVDLTGYIGSGSASSVVITEVDTSPDVIEFMNVSSSAVDISGWQISVYDGVWPEPRAIIQVPASTVANVGDLFRLDENGTAPGTYPQFYTGVNIDWVTVSKVSVLLRDETGEVIDFMCAAGASPVSSITNPVSISPSEWTSDPVVAKTSETVTYQRTGDSDRNSSNDWVIASENIGTVNPGLILPFAGGMSAVLVTPTNTASFVSGVWSGNVAVHEQATNMWLRADDGSGHTGDSTPFDVGALPPLIVTVPETATEGDGVITGVVAVTVMPISNLVVNLVSDDTSEATVSNTVTILAGEPQAEFDISIEDDADLDGSQSATITASALIYAPGSDRIAVHDNETATLGVVLPASAAESVGVVTGQVTISSTVATNVVVALASGDPSEATVPGTVTVLAGQSHASFDVTIHEDTLIDGTQPVVLTAHVENWTDGSNTIAVLDNEHTNLIVALPASATEVDGVATNAGTVSISGTLTNDLSISLFSDDTSELTVTPLVRISMGSTSVMFDVSIEDDTIRDGAKTACVHAAASGFAAGSDCLIVADNEGEIRGSKWCDWNTNGVWDVGEEGLEGWKIYVDVNTNELWDVGEPYDLTDATGRYAIGASPGIHFVSEEMHSGWSQMYPGTNGDAGELSLVAMVRDGVDGVDGLNFASSVTVSPDGNHVYAAGRYDGAVAVFSRDASSGQLTYVGMVKDGVDGVDGLYGASSVTVSPDGSHLYAAGLYDDAVAVFSRDASSGQLTYVGMVKDGVDGVDGLNGASSVTVSPDGSHVYTAGGADDAVAVFSRDASSGQLTYVGMVKDGVDGVDGLYGASSVTVSPDGSHLYAAGSYDDAVAVFSRDASSGQMTYVGMVKDGVDGVDGLNGASSVTVSPDGSHVYAGGQYYHAVTVFSRDASSGQITYVGIAKDALDGVDGLYRACSVTVSPDGSHVYAAGQNDNAVAVFKRCSLVVGTHMISVDLRQVFDGIDFGNLPPEIALVIPSPVTEGNGTMTGVVSVSAAPNADLVVDLLSDNTDEITLTNAVTIPAGQTNATIELQIVDDTELDGTQYARITASALLYRSVEFTVHVHDNESAGLNVLLPASATEGAGVVTGQLTVSASVDDDVVISLSSDDTSEITVPSSVVVSSGLSSASFEMSVVDDGDIDGTQSALITAHVENWTDGSDTMAVYDNEHSNLMVTLPAYATEGDGVLPGAGTVSISGTLSNDLVVSLLSDDTSELTVTSLVTISVGSVSVAFDVFVQDDIEHDGTQDVCVEAVAPGFVGVSNCTEVLDNDVHGFAFETIASPQFAAVPFAFAVSAIDSNGVLISTYTGPANLSAEGDGGALPIAPSNTMSFVNGRWIGDVSVYAADSNVVLNADDGFGHTGTSNPFHVEMDLDQVSLPSADFAAPMIIDRLLLDAESRIYDGPWDDDMSGCCVWPSFDGVLLVIQNKRGSLGPGIELCVTDGSYAGSIDLEGFDDTEGICVYRPESNLFAIVEEGSNDITIVTIEPTTTSIDKESGTTISMDLDLIDPNEGIEGITYDSGRDCFYAVKEKNPMAVYVISNYLGAVAVDLLFDAEEVFEFHCTDLSDLVYDPCSDRLFILSDESAKLMECTRDGVVIGSTPISMPQPEGVTFSPLSPEVYIVGEPNYYHRYSLQPLATSLDEGQEFVAEVQLNHPYPLPLTVAFEVWSAEAESGLDYFPEVGDVTFPPGQTSAYIRIELLADIDLDDGETIHVELLPYESDVEIGLDRVRECTILDVPPLSIDPEAGWVASGYEEGPFSPSNIVYTLTNTSDSALTWIAECSATWVNLSPTNGTLPGGSTTTVTASLAGAESVPVGTNENVIVFGNVTSGSIHSRQVQLVVYERVLDHFAWDIIGPTQYVETTFPVRITAKDATGEILSTFDESVGIVGLTTGEVTMTEGTMLERVAHDSSGFVWFGGYSRGLRFSLAKDLTVTHVLHYWGDKVSLWTDSGDNMLSMDVTSVPGEWVETALNSPITLTAGAVYRIAAYDNSWYRLDTPPSATFAGGSILSSCYSLGDSFPATEDLNITTLVDFRYLAADGDVFAVSPPITSPFVDGVWTGAVAVHERASNLFLRADADGHPGDSNPFDVLLPLTIDLPAGADEGSGTFIGVVSANPPPASGLVVQLTSTDTSEVTLATNFITLAMGQASAPFTVVVQNDDALDGTQHATITASAPGCAEGSDAVLIHDDESATLTLALPASVMEGSGTITGEVTVSAVVEADLDVDLSSDSPSSIGIQPSATILTGLSNATVVLTVHDDGEIDGIESVTLTAHVENWVDGYASTDVIDDEGTNLLLSLPAVPQEGDGLLPQVGRVSISGTLGEDLTVSLLSDDVSELAVTSEVVIASGTTNVCFDLRVVDDAEKDGIQSVCLEALASGFTPGSACVDVHDDEGRIQGTKWLDANSNGVWDTEEQVLQGWTIYSDVNANAQWDSGEPQDVTDTNGSYTLDVEPGVHLIREELRDGWYQTFPGSNGVSTGNLTFVQSLVDGEDGVDGLDGACAVAVSPDGSNVYLAAEGDEAISSFSRDPASGTLNYIHCIENGTNGVEGLSGTWSLVVSSNGDHVYAAGALDHAVVVCQRNQTNGELTFIEMIDDSTVPDVPLALAISPDGSNLYVSSAEIAVFSCDPVSGQLTHTQTITDGDVGQWIGLVYSLAVSPDGLNVYAANWMDSAVFAFARNAVDGELTHIDTLDLFSGVSFNSISAVSVSPDGRHVYVGGSEGGELAVCRRHMPTGDLTYAGPPLNATAHGGGLVDVESLVVSPDGSHVYAAGYAADYSGDALAALSRNPSSGELTYVNVARDGTNGVEGLDWVQSVAVSPDGRHVYAAGGGDDAVAVFAHGDLPPGTHQIFVTPQEIVTNVNFGNLPPDLTLTVESTRGGVWAGTVTNKYGAFIEQWITNSPISGGSGTQYVCVAADVVGNEFVQVSPTNVALTLTNDATLTWQWVTNYWLDTATNGCGTVSSDDRWVAGGSNVVIEATACDRWHFTGWSGDTNGCIFGSPITVPMTQARQIVANFSVDDIDVQITDIRVDGSNIVVEWVSSNGWRYLCEFADDLEDDPVAWSNLSSGWLTSTQLLMSNTDTNARVRIKRFYRVRVKP